MNINYSLATPDVTHLNDKGSEQVSNYFAFVRQKFDDIKKGELAKQAVARHYLEQENLTEAADKLISNLNDALGISKGYISQIRIATRFVDSLGDGIASKQLKSFVEEHPVTVQYRMSKLEPEVIEQQMSTGKRFTKRQLEEFTRVNQEEEKLNATPEPTPYQSHCARAKEMIDSEDYPYITTISSYEAHSKGMHMVFLAMCQHLQDYTPVGTINRLTGLREMQRLLSQAIALESRKYEGLPL